MRDAKQNGREPAMPFSGRHAEYVGLTKREHFAALAMQGVLAGDTAAKLPVERVAGVAVACADALIKELDRTAG